jgi:hypothetical protein
MFPASLKRFQSGVYFNELGSSLFLNNEWELQWQILDESMGPDGACLTHSTSLLVTQQSGLPFVPKYRMSQNSVRFQVLTAASVEMTSLLACCVVCCGRSCRLFRSACCLHYQGDRLAPCRVVKFTDVSEVLTAPHDLRHWNVGKI